MSRLWLGLGFCPGGGEEQPKMHGMVGPVVILVVVAHALVQVLMICMASCTRILEISGKTSLSWKGACPEAPQSSQEQSRLQII